MDQTYIIVYSLISRTKDYNPLLKEIKSLGDSQQPLPRVWIVRTPLNVQEISQRLMPLINNSDSIFISKVNNNTSRGWLSKDFWDWFNQVKQ